MLKFHLRPPAGCPIYIYKHAHISAAQPAQGVRSPDTVPRMRPRCPTARHAIRMRPRCPTARHAIRMPTVPKVSGRMLMMPKDAQEMPATLSGCAQVGRSQSNLYPPIAFPGSAPLRSRKRSTAIHVQKGFNPRCLAHSLIAYPGYSPPFDDDRLAYPGSLIDCDYGDCSVD
jgi:hypothetical protein